MLNVSTGAVLRVIIIIVAAVIVFYLIPMLSEYLNDAFVPTQNPHRFPIFGSALGGITGTLFGFLPTLLYAGTIGLGAYMWSYVGKGN